MSTEAVVRLVYQNGRGVGEGIRMVLCVAGIKFEDTTLQSNTEFESLKKEGKLLFGQVPVLEIDGLVITQTRAIVQYVAHKAGLAGANLKEAARISELYEGTRDFLSPFLGVYFSTTEEESRKKLREETMPKYLPIFNKVLEDTGTGYLFGNALSLADVGLLEVLLYCLEYFGDGILEEFKPLKNFIDKMKKNEGIQCHLKHHRKDANTKQYADACKRILGRRK